MLAEIYISPAVLCQSVNELKSGDYKFGFSLFPGSMGIYGFLAGQ